MSSRPGPTGPLTAAGLLRVGLLVLTLVVAWIVLSRLSELALIFIVAIVIYVVVLLPMTFRGLSASRPLAAFFLDLLPGEGRQPAASIWEQIAGRFAGYVRGVAVNMIVIGLLVFLAATVLDLPAAILLGV